jgi:amino acid adenylation domain-containing protein
MNAAQLLQELQTRRISLTLANGRLQLKAPKGTLTDEIKAALGFHKEALIATLAVDDDPPPATIPSAPPSDSYRLSFSQERLWFLDQFGADASSYAMPTTMRVIGRLDLEAAGACINAIVARHAPLRTVFENVGGEGRQRMLPPEHVQIPYRVVELGGGERQERLAKARALVEAEMRRPFDLSTGPLLRVLVVALGGEEPEHIVLFTMHHIVSDGWSSDVLVREFATLYEARLAGRPAQLPELPIQYVDYAVWQRDWLAGAILERRLAFWREALFGANFLLDLSSDRPRPPAQDNVGQTLSFEVPPATVAKLRSLSRAEGATLYMTLLAAFFVLLSRRSGETDICVGTPVANRRRVEFEGLIGFFVNTLVMRGDLSGDPDFVSFLARVRAFCLGAQEHQDLPFERLVEALAPQRDLSRNPLFQTMFSLQNAPARRFALEGLAIERFESERGTAKFDLSLELIEEEDGRLRGEAEFATALFDRATIERMIGHYTTLLGAIVATPRARVSELDILLPQERELLHGFNALRSTYPQEGLLHEFFAAQVAKTPHATALVFEDKTLSYEELNAWANRLAHWLIKRNVGPESIVALCLERSLEMVVAVLAALKAGGGYLPLDPSLPDERLATMIEDAGPKALLTHEKLRSRLARIVEGGGAISLDALFAFDEDGSTLEVEPDYNPKTATAPQNIAYLIYTSGSTGKPKAVAVPHSNVVRLFTATQTVFNFAASDVWTLFHSYAFDFSVWEIWGALLFGGRLVVVPYFVSRSSQDFHKLLVDHAVTVLNQTPSAFHRLDDVDALSEGSAPLSLRLVIFGGEALDQRRLASWFKRRSDDRPRLVNMYGITETTVHVTLTEIAVKDALGVGAGTIGRPLSDLDCYILDRRFAPAPVGVCGELYVGGAGLARGYVNRPDLTAERFVPNPFSEAGERLYRTGDLARFRSDGAIEYLGRADHQVKIRGFRIELGEIEAALGKLPGVRASIVVVREGADGDKRLVAYVAAQAPQDFDAAAARDALRATLPDYMAPQTIIALQQLPLNANGKIDRRALPDVAADAATQSVFVPPRNATEEAICRIWAKVLDRRQIGINDNFFDNGGHSLKAAQATTHVRDLLKWEVPLKTLFERPTVAFYAEVLEGLAKKTGDRPLSPAPLSDLYSVSFSQERLWFLDRFEPGSSSYAMPAAVRLTGAIDVGSFGLSIGDIVERHSSLRTVFVSVGGEARQRVLAAGAVSVPCPVLDLSGMAKAEREARARTLVEEETRRPFDLTRGPLLRVLALDMGGSGATREHIVVFTMHHIVSDGWSGEILVREFTAFYEARLAGRAAELPPLPIQYVDYAVWQRDWLSGDVIEKQLAFWRDALADARFTLDLPTDRPRPTVQDNAGRTVKFAVPATLAEGLRQLSRQHGATLYMTLLSAFFILLSRWSGERDICVGTPVANRRRVELEGLIGFFVNTLVMRGDLSGDPEFSSFLSRVRGFCLGAQEHQDLPFERLVEALSPVRDLSRTPLFQTMFSVQNAPARDFSLPGLTIEAYEAESGTAKFDLSFEFSEEPNGRLAGEAEYATALFDQSTVERMIGHYLTLLGSIVATPHARLGALDILTAAERERLLVGFNATAADFPRDLSISELFVAQAGRSPEATAVACKGETLSYGELDRRSNRLARSLIEAGAGPERIVGLCVERSIDMIVALLAILKSGAGYLPLDPDYPRARLAYMIEDAGPVITVTRASLQERLPKDARLLPFDLAEEAARTAAQSDAAVPPRAAPQNAAYVIYTSGSTGKPKGVAVSQAALVNCVVYFSKRIGLTPADRWLSVTSMSFDIAALELFCPIVTGGMTVVAERARLFERDYVNSQIEAFDITIVQATPALWRDLIHNGWQGRARLTGLIGGEAVSCDLAAALKQRVGACLVVYGPTETTIWSTDAPIAELPSLIGAPIGNTQAYLLDHRLEPVPIGVAGEIYIGGEGVARGYLGRADLTAEKFMPDPFGPPGARLYRTGDLGRRREDGRILFLGRADHQVKIRGFRIELGEIEAAIGALLPGVRASIVVARDEADGGKRLVAYVATPAPEGFDAAAARETLRATLPDYMVPQAIVALAQLPLNANGKIDRNVLPEIDGPKSDRALSAPPKTPSEWIILEAFKETLSRADFGMEDNFFEFGGNSILGLKLVERIRRTLRDDLFVAAIFNAPTPAAFARLLKATQATNRSPLVELAPAERPPLYCIHPAGGSVVRYRALAERLGQICSIYGVQSRSLLQPDYRASSIDELARDYAAVIRSRQPSGPYRLVGWSAGGALALAVAAELERDNERVDFIGLLDPVVATAKESRKATMDEFLKTFAELQDLRLELTEADAQRLIETSADLDERETFIAAGLWGAERGFWTDVSPDMLALLYDDSKSLGDMLAQFRIRPVNADLHIWWAKDGATASAIGWTRGEVRASALDVSHELIVVDPTALAAIEQILNSIIRSGGAITETKSTY